MLLLTQKAFWNPKYKKLCTFTFVRVEDTSTPERGTLMSDNVEPRHDSEVRLSATDRAVKIKVLRGIGIDNVARSKDNLEIGYVVACEPVFWREKRQST
jgi:hypothetical protein